MSLGLEMTWKIDTFLLVIYFFPQQFNTDMLLKPKVYIYNELVLGVVSMFFCPESNSDSPTSYLCISEKLFHPQHPHL